MRLHFYKTTVNNSYNPFIIEGISQPRYVDGLLSPREISNALFDATHNQHFSERHTTLLMGWGQFFCHDIALTMHVPGELSKNAIRIKVSMSKIDIV